MDRRNSAFGDPSSDDSKRQEQNTATPKSREDSELIDMAAEQLAQLLFDYVRHKRRARLGKLPRGSG